MLRCAALMCETSSRCDSWKAGSEILRSTRGELVRADAKAASLFASSGVAFGALFTGWLNGHWSPLPLHHCIQLIWWAGAAAAAAALAHLGWAVYPRTKRSERDGRSVAYFGDVVRLSRDELAAAFTDHPVSCTASMIDQVYEVSMIVARKYALIKIAFFLLGLSILLGVISVVLGALIPAN